MELYPAIDVCNGKAVRLLRGDYSAMTVYGDDPVGVASVFRSLGAKFMHTVDLDGAKGGGTPNFDVLIKAAKAFGGFAEVGGGIRSLDVCEKYLSGGMSRVVIGTAALEDPDLLALAVKEYGERIAVGADARNGFVSVKGWTQDSGADLFGFCKKIAKAGVRTVICTDISRDGAMAGVNLALYKELLAKTGLNIIASGGVSSLGDITALKLTGVRGAIIGKAYYTGAVDLKEALEAAR